ncbi:MAG TPA: adenylate/guanylate cyclase domain-containing protein [Solirubrobacterales bacterium]|nr:adenylate/guanylate cyclase domain-containing protein [Solirubrobacterales bacterium]
MQAGRLRVRWLLGVAAIAVAVGVVAYATDALREPELDTIDARFSIRGTESPPDDVVVVGVDDITFSQLDRRWPFPRSLHARVIDNLVRDGARVIAYDVQFTEPTTPREDNALIRSVQRADGKAHVVLATTEVGRDGRTNVFGGDRVIKSIGATVGNGNLIPDPGDVIRRTAYELQNLETFAVAAATAPGDIEVDPGRFDDDGGAWIDYAGPPETLEHVPFSDAYEGHFEDGTFEDKFVVIGTTAPSLQDVHPTSVSGGDTMSGPEIQASALATVRAGAPLQSSPAAVDIVLIVLFALVPPLATLRISPVAGLLLAIGTAIVYAIAVQLSFEWEGVVLSFLYPLGTLAIATVGTVAVHYVTATMERQRTRDIFARFVPESVVDQVLARTDEDLRLGGTELEGTILFSDIRGFTTFSETYPAEEVLEILNVYLSGMTDAILTHGGTITTYIGDGIMALFGGPIPQSDHADRALATAREMLEVKLPEFNAWLSARGIEPFRMGVGLNSGAVMAGNVGSERRLEYTAIGDTVNTAARLEGMTKGTPHQLFVADSTRSRLADPEALVYVDEFEVRGRLERVRIWSVPRTD